MAEPRKRPTPRPITVDVEKAATLAGQHPNLFKTDTPAAETPAEPLVKAIPDETAAEITGAIVGLVDFMAARDAEATQAANQVAAQLAAITERTSDVEKALKRAPVKPAVKDPHVYTVQRTALRISGALIATALVLAAVLTALWLLVDAGVL